MNLSALSNKKPPFISWKLDPNKIIFSDAAQCNLGHGNFPVPSCTYCIWFNRLIHCCYQKEVHAHFWQEFSYSIGPNYLVPLIAYLFGGIGPNYPIYFLVYVFCQWINDSTFDFSYPWFIKIVCYCYCYQIFVVHRCWVHQSEIEPDQKHALLLRWD